MHCTTNRTISHSDRLYRSRNDKVFSGLCGGLSEHFGISSFWLRVGFIIGTIITFPVIPIIYLLCVFLIPLESSYHGSHTERRRARKRAVPRFRNREEAMSHLNSQMDLIEDKICKLEDHVTSKEYVLKRKFEDL